LLYQWFVFSYFTRILWKLNVAAGEKAESRTPVYNQIVLMKIMVADLVD
jgi:hypothetical protein